MKRRYFVQNVLFNLKENDAKKSLFPNQSSIEILVLIINSIASQPNLNVSFEVSPLFHFNPWF
jgi:hypothetical protein